MPSVVVITTRIYTTFPVPKGVTLRDPNKVSNSKPGPEKPWSWSIWRNTLTYWDDKGQEHEIEGHEHEDGDAVPDDTEIDDGENWGYDSSDSEEEEESSEESDEEPEAEEVYLVVNGVDDLCGNHEHLKKFKTYSTEEGDYKTTYFQTYGGGPEGGYFLRTFYGLNGFDPVDEVYEVKRGWGEAFTVSQMNGCLDYNEAGDGTAGTCRFIPGKSE